jgi:predicted Zn-dependent protease with MMP-like domain
MSGHLTREVFEDEVVEALELVPDEFRDYLKEVAVVVEEWPSVEQRQRLNLRQHETLFGLYEGVPRTQRNSGYNLALPDRITLFQGPLERFAGPDRQRLRQQVRRTVLHEIAHHFGFGEERLRELGY